MKLVLIDGNSIFFRAYYATAYGNMMKNKEGVYTNALFAFINMMERILESDYSHILVAFDTDQPTHRHKASKDYKAHRPPMPSEMAMQIPLIHNYLKYKGIKDVSFAGYEADDIIGTLSRLGSDELHVDIYSSDQDLLQLINDHVTVKLIKKGTTDIRDMTPATFKEEYTFSHKYMLDYKALMGDPSDNIKGIPGVGKKTAMKLILEYGDMDSIYAHKDEIKGKLGESIRENEALAKESYELSKILLDVPLNLTLDDLKKNGIDYENLIKFYEEMDFHQFIKRMDSSDRFIESAHTFKVAKKEDLDLFIKENISIHCEFLDFNYHTSDVVGIGISDGKNHIFVDEDVMFSNQAFMDFLKSDVVKYTYDYKAFKVRLLNKGYDLNGVGFDLLLASYIDNPQIAKNEFKVIVSTFDYDDLEYDELIYGKGAKKALPDQEVYQEHVTKKAKAIYKLRPHLLEQLEEKEQLSLLLDLEIPLSNVLAKMEYEGIMVDKDILKSLKKDYKKKITDLEQRIYQLALKEFNINSPKQLGEVLFVDLGLEPSKKTKGKSYSTNIDVLNSLIDEHPIIREIIDYRSVSKLYSTYIEGIENALFEDGKVHTIYNQALTVTGRLSSLEPNLQNIPVKTEEGRQIRKLFTTNHYLMSADYSQIELRVLAHMSQCENLINDFNKGLDIHSETAKKVFNSMKVSSEERRKAKAVNFGIIYGIGAFSLSEDIHSTRAEAQAFIDKYFSVYPEIDLFMKQQIEHAKTHGFVKTIMNRRRYINELKSPIYTIREFGKRTSMNAPIQGSAADILKKAMVDLDHYLTKNNLKSKLLLTVHDELILEVVEEELEIMKTSLKEIMSKTVSLSVKLETDLSVGKSWYDI
ncbi:MAG: DNA polymerase I [Acholeplasmataceae bacterium]